MEKLLTLKQMAEKMNVNEKTFKKYVAVYKIPHVAFGRDKRFNPDKVENHMESLIVQEAAPVKMPARKRRFDISKSSPDEDFFARELGLI